MHYHLEIIMPPVDNVEKAVAEIMKPFDENGEDSYHPFWDFYVIGGRWAGHKQTCQFDENKMEQFYAALKENNVKVSGVTAGKQEISPASQIPMVDELWRKHFPDGGEICPLFKHYNDQYKNSDGWPDIMKVSEMPKNLTAGHVIVAGYGYKGDILEAKTMYQDSIWNGVTHVDSAWDRKVQTIIDKHNEGLKNARDDYKEKHTVKDDWIVVTVDYHS